MSTSPLFCSKCKNKCIFKSRPASDEVFGASCDSCNNIICRACAEITTTEAHAVALSQRSILFYCGDCKFMIKDLPKYKKLTEILEETRAELKAKRDQLQCLEYKFDEDIQERTEIIDKLRNEINEKNMHINRLNRRTIDFEDEVVNAEQSFVEKLEKQKKEIGGLNKELIEVVEKNQNLSLQITELKEENTSLKRKVSEFTKIKTNLLTSIETLTKDNECYSSELKKAKFEIFSLKENNTKKVDMKITNKNKETTKESKEIVEIMMQIERKLSNIITNKELLQWKTDIMDVVQGACSELPTSSDSTLNDLLTSVRTYETSLQERHEHLVASVLEQMATKLEYVSGAIKESNSDLVKFLTNDHAPYSPKKSIP